MVNYTDTCRLMYCPDGYVTLAMLFIPNYSPQEHYLNVAVNNVMIREKSWTLDHYIPLKAQMKNSNLIKCFTILVLDGRDAPSVLTKVRSLLNQLYQPTLPSKQRLLSMNNIGIYTFLHQLCLSGLIRS